MAYKPTEVRFIMRSPVAAFDVLDVVDYMNANGIKSHSEILRRMLQRGDFPRGALHPGTDRRYQVPRASGSTRPSGAIGDDVFVAHANERIINPTCRRSAGRRRRPRSSFDANGGTGTS